MHHCQRKPGSHRRIHGIAARLQDVHANMRCQFVYAHHHAMRGMHRMNRRRGGQGGARQQQRHNHTAQ